MILMRNGYLRAIPANPLVLLLRELLADIDAVISWLGRSVVRAHKLIWVSVAILLGVLAVWPLGHDQLQFADVFKSSLLLAAVPIPLIPIILSPLFSRFNLRFFQINRESPRRSRFSPRIITYFVITIIGREGWATYSG
jgi:hypothetical protein